MQVIVHGGAGGTPDDPEPRQAVLDEAAAAGTTADSPVAAVVAAVRMLESSPRFNAGVGGAVQSDGVVRTDAGLMTDDRAAGAACAMVGVEHAIDVARVVMDQTPHVLVAGTEAVALAEAFGVETGCDLLTERTRQRWADLDPAPPAPDADRREHLAWIRDRFGGGDGNDPPRRGPSDPHECDTVGAVARDGTDFAAATSTGGRWCALAGRVGDVPQIGAGLYCGPAGGASATGAGEDIARVSLSRRAVAHLEAGHDAATAAERAIEEFGELTGSTAGLIVLGPDGAGSAYDSDGMQTSVVRR